MQKLIQKKQKVAPKRKTAPKPKKATKIKIFGKEIDSTMSYRKILKICKTIKNTRTAQDKDYEKRNFTTIRVDEIKKDDKDPYIAYEIIFNDGKLESVEHWRVQIIYATVPKGKIRVIQS